MSILVIIQILLDVGVEQTGQASHQMKDPKGIRRLSDF